MTNRTVQNIQKIARTKEIQKAIDELRAIGQLDNFQEISGRRGRAFKNESFNNSNSSQNSSTTSLTAGSSPLSGDGTGLQIPVSSEQGSENADDFLNDESDLFTSGGGDDGLSGQQQLRELTGLEDCLTGDPFEVRFDGHYKSPIGWSEANTPPGGGEDETWDQGAYYEAAITVLTDTGNQDFTEYGATATELWPFIKSSYDNNNATGAVLSWESEPEIISAVESGTLVLKTFRRFYKTCLNDSCTSGFSVSVTQYSCTPSHPSGADAACLIMSAPTTPTETEWPEDPSRPTYLSWNAETGKFEPSVYDPDVPAKYENGASELNLCTEDGKFITITPTRDGGFAIYETSSSGGPLAVDATIKKLDRNLTLEGVIDEDQLNFYLPR